LFANAIEDLSRIYDQVRYGWTDFLPIHRLADFWAPLEGGIRIALATRDLVADSRENMLRISNLRFIPTSFRHGDEPLLRSQYDLSARCEEEIVEKLRKWGLETLSKTEMLAIMRQDIEQALRLVYRSFSVSHLRVGGILSSTLFLSTRYAVTSSTRSRWVS